jgi:glycosyltransferase involved in cell wall biosynthesis
MNSFSSPELNQPKVSVLITFYNCEKFIGTALDSILNQTFRDLEVVLIDDGSTDGSLKVVNGYRDKRIRLIKSEKNLGIGGARNRALGFCRGEYIAIMDADDIAMQDRLEKQVAFLEQHDDVGLVSSFVVLMTEDSEHVGVRELPTSHQEILERLTKGIMCVVHAASFARRKCMEEISYRDKFPCSVDYDFLLRFAEKFKIGVIPEPLLDYRLNTGSVTVVKRRAQEYCRAAIKRFAQEREATGSDSYDEFSCPDFSGPEPRPRKALSEYRLHIGKMFGAFGNVRRARAYFAKSILANPLRLRPYLLLLLALLGKKVYGLMQRKFGTSDFYQ